MLEGCTHSALQAGALVLVLVIGVRLKREPSRTDFKFSCEACPTSVSKTIFVDNQADQIEVLRSPNEFDPLGHLYAPLWNLNLPRYSGTHLRLSHGTDIESRILQRKVSDDQRLHIDGLHESRGRAFP